MQVWMLDGVVGQLKETRWLWGGDMVVAGGLNGKEKVVGEDY